MAFKGVQNLKGRPAGAKNKVSTEVKQVISNILEDNVQEFYLRMDNLSDADYCKIYLQLLRFVIPTMRSIDTPVKKKEFPFDKVEIEIIGRDDKELKSK